MLFLNKSLLKLIQKNNHVNSGHSIADRRENETRVSPGLTLERAGPEKRESISS